MRDVERRFARLEERLLKETQDLKDDVKRGSRRSKLRAHRTGVTCRSAQPNATIARGASASLARELHDGGKALERRATALDEQLAKGQRELRQQMLEQHQR